MYKILIIILFFSISNCSLKKVDNHHGVNFLEKKQEKLILSTTNVNDILKILGPPSTKSTFDNDLWIYIERKISKSNILTLGKKTTVKNNVLVLEINTRGLLVKKDFINIEDMNELNFSKETTINIYSKKSFVYDFLSSMRQKINDPLGKRKNRKK